MDVVTGSWEVTPFLYINIYTKRTYVGGIICYYPAYKKIHFFKLKTCRFKKIYISLQCQTLKQTLNKTFSMKRVNPKIIELARPLLKRPLDCTETLTQLKSDLAKFWSWGVHDTLNLYGKGLMFKVDGRIHRGWVLIALDYADTYDVHIISYHGKIKQSHHDVYCDMIVDVIDRLVETK